MSDLICIRFLDSYKDWNKGSIQEMLYDWGMNLILDGYAEEITKKEYDEISLKKHNKTAHNKMKVDKEVKEFKQKKKNLFESPNWLELLENLKDEIVFYYDKNCIWWMWDGEKYKWEICDETDILVEILNKYPSTDLTSHKTKTELVNSMKLYGRSRKLKNPKTKWIQFKDKVFNIETKDIFPVSKDHFFTNPISWEIGETDKTPIMDKLIISWVGEENKQLMYEIIAYCIYRDYPIHRIFCFVGSGRNGKSKYLGLITKLLGEHNSTSSDLDLLMSRPFESFKLYKKLLCQMGETNYEGLKRTAILKQLSGQDMISYEKKGKDGFTDYNYAKLIISTNGIPITHDKSDGFYRRWLIVDFPNNFPEGKDILKSIPDVEYENLCLKCINILPKLLDVGKFTNEPSIEEKKRIYEEKSNPLVKFLRDRTKKDFSGIVYKYEFNQRFLVYLNENGYRSLNNNEINAMMREFYDDGKKAKEDSIIWAWIGLKWKDISNISNISNENQLETHIENGVETVGNVGNVGNIDKVLEEWEKVDDIKSMQELLDLGLSEKDINRLSNERVIFKPLNDGYKLL